MEHLISAQLSNTGVENVEVLPAVQTACFTEPMRFPASLTLLRNAAQRRYPKCNTRSTAEILELCMRTFPSEEKSGISITSPSFRGSIRKAVFRMISSTTPPQPIPILGGKSTPENYGISRNRPLYDSGGFGSAQRDRVLRNFGRLRFHTTQSESLRRRHPATANNRPVA